VSAADVGQTGHSMAGHDTPSTLASVRHLARHQVMGLSSVFLLGMAVNLTGLPSQTSGDVSLASIAFLATHVLIALGLVIGTVLLLRATVRLGGRWRRQAIAGTAAVAVAVATGILTLITESNWWSYAMAVGFIAALLAYSSLLLPATSPAQDNRPPSTPEA
jgi:heme A synthase